MRKVQVSQTPLVRGRALKSRDYSRSAEMSTVSEVTIGFSVKRWVYDSLKIILQSNQERFSRIVCSILSWYSGGKTSARRM